MIFAIDFDKTWTAEPRGWAQWYQLFTGLGHTVIMVTGRREMSEDMRRYSLPPAMPIVFAGPEMKEKAATLAGWKVDVWIDDMPGTIQEVHFLQPAPDAAL